MENKNKLLELKTNETENILEEINTIMLEEMRFYANKNQTISNKASRLNITDRIAKSAGVILAVENLKERRFMNRTERKSEIRKLNQTKQD